MCLLLFDVYVMWLLSEWGNPNFYKLKIKTKTKQRINEYFLYIISILLTFMTISLDGVVRKDIFIVRDLYRRLLQRIVY